MYTIVLSGPAGYRQPTVRALQAAGINVADTTHDHGLGLERGEQAITCTADHPDQVTEAACGLGWRLRSHWPAAMPLAVAPPDPAEELAELKAALRAKGII